jgi:hypothetical protein
MKESIINSLGPGESIIMDGGRIQIHASHCTKDRVILFKGLQPGSNILYRFNGDAELHCECGPAVSCGNGMTKYYLYGIEISEDRYLSTPMCELLLQATLTRIIET